MIVRYLSIYALIALGYIFAFVSGARDIAVQAMEQYTRISQVTQDTNAVSDILNSPEKTVRQIEAKSQNWNEPSQDSEERYIKAYSQWLDKLPEQQQHIARQILADDHQGLSALRQAIRAKKAELASISFNETTSPKQLSRLGVELRSLQSTLYNRLKLVSNRMRNEAGLEMGKLERQSLWLLPPMPSPQFN